MPNPKAGCWGQSSLKARPFGEGGPQAPARVSRGAVAGVCGNSRAQACSAGSLQAGASYESPSRIWRALRVSRTLDPMGRISVAGPISAHLRGS